MHERKETQGAFDEKPSMPKQSLTPSTTAKRASFFIGDQEGNKLPVKIVGPDEQEITPDEIVVPPDGGYGYVIVFAAFMSNVIVDGIVFSFGCIKDPIKDAANRAGVPIENATIAWVGSLLTGFYLLAGPFVSAIANKFGFRVVAILGSLLASGAFLVTWYLNAEKPNLALLIIFYGIVGGIGFSCIYVPAVIAVGFYFEKKRALATGIAICGSGIGGLAFPPLIGVFVDKFEWQGAILIMGLIVLSCAALGILYKPLKPKATRKMSVMAPGDSPEGTPLLMRIKRARDVMSKWDSVNSFASNKESFADSTKPSELTYNRTRKSSTPSLRGTTSPVAIPLSMQKKRMSVPSMMPGGVGESPRFTPADPNASQQASTLKSKSFVGLPDLHEIEEEHGEESGSKENSVVPDDQSHPRTIESYADLLKQKLENNNETNALLNQRNASVTTCRIGNSMLMVDEMTNSKIIRVASRVTLNKPLYRDDIFYSGSLLRIPDYANNAMTSTEWTAAVTSPPQQPEPSVPKKKCGSCGIIGKMLDFSLLASPTFIVFSISGMFTMLGMFVPFVYIMDQANYVMNVLNNEGVTKNRMSIFLSTIGAANTVGRILAGWVADRPCINALWLNNGAVIIMGLSTGFIPFLTEYWHFIIYSCVFGISMACFASLRSILVVELLGLEKLTNAFGLLLLFQGIASMIATPLAGMIVKYTGAGGDFSAAFYAAGAFLVFSAILCFPLARIQKAEDARKEKKAKDKAINQLS